MPASRRPDAGRLRALVRAEARRAGDTSAIAADPARTAAGWERRFVVERARAAELVRLYEELGYEAVADPVPPGPAAAPAAPGAQGAPGAPAEGCGACPVASALEFCLIYTRSRPAAGG